jgi:hypothetical protein
MKPAPQPAISKTAVQFAIAKQAKKYRQSCPAKPAEWRSPQSLFASNLAFPCALRLPTNYDVDAQFAPPTLQDNNSNAILAGQALLPFQLLLLSLT